MCIRDRLNARRPYAIARALRSGENHPTAKPPDRAAAIPRLRTGGRTPGGRPADTHVQILQWSDE
eukprot:7780456-Lingulodinium_polyedra.AAC.1